MGVSCPTPCERQFIAASKLCLCCKLYPPGVWSIHALQVQQIQQKNVRLHSQWKVHGDTPLWVVLHWEVLNYRSNLTTVCMPVTCTHVQIVLCIDLEWAAIKINNLIFVGLFCVRSFCFCFWKNWVVLGCGLAWVLSFILLLFCFFLQLFNVLLPLAYSVHCFVSIMHFVTWFVLSL